MNLRISFAPFPRPYNMGMSKNTNKFEDTNQAAARVVREATESHDKPLPHDLEEAWARWSKQIKAVDRRGMELLRSAFEVGREANRRG